MTIRVAVLYPTDLAGHTAGGIDSYVRGILQHAPSDLSITLFGAAGASSGHALGRELDVQRDRPANRWMPLVYSNSIQNRGSLPFIAQYAIGLLQAIGAGKLRKFDILDFHRIEPALLFRWDRRPRRLIMHQDLSGVLDSHSEIRWKRAPLIYKILERLVLPTIDQLRVVRKTSYDSYAKRFPKLVDRIEFTPTFFDSDAYSYVSDDAKRLQLRVEARRWLGLSESTRLLMFAGRLDEAKNPKLLVEALAAAPLLGEETHLILIGDGALRAQVASLIDRMGLETRVRMLGSQPKQIIRRVMHAADLFVLSSAYEGMPIAVLEALACGLPVVSTNVGELPNLITDNVNGMLCKGTSPVEFASCVRAALDNVGAIGGERCAGSVHRFRAKVILEETYRTYRRLAARPTLDGLIPQIAKR